MNEKKIADFKKQAYESFKNSESLQLLKQISIELTLDEFLEFANMAMLDAYRKNRTKAVSYMLNFYPKNEPIMLLKIHVSVMLTQEKEIEKNKIVMLKSIYPHFSNEVFYNFLEQPSQNNRRNEIQKQRQEYRKRQILDIILEKSLPEKENDNMKRHKI